MKEKILIVEDEEDILDNIRILLESEKYQVFTAKDGIAGLELARLHQPDLIICDIMMPGIDGYGVLTELSKDKKLCCTPFVFLTAKVERKDLRKGMELGADDYIFKPFTYDEILIAIKTRLSKHNKIIASVSFSKNESLDENDSRVNSDGSVFIKYHDKTLPVKVKRIKYVLAENQYSQLVCEDNRSFLIRKSLERWENILPLKYFIRIHRSTLINIDYIDRVEKTEDGKTKIIVKNTQTEFEISRRYLRKFKTAMYR
ncbi:MAG: response regulator [bacterium]